MKHAVSLCAPRFPACAHAHIGIAVTRRKPMCAKVAENRLDREAVKPADSLCAHVRYVRIPKGREISGAHSSTSRVSSLKSARAARARRRVPGAWAHPALTRLRPAPDVEIQTMR